MAKEKEKMMNVDLYAILGVEADCPVQAIKKAYRKKALECHPDKNPDNVRAVELFHELSYALEILLDESARAAYDKVLNGRKAAAVRSSKLSASIKKFKDNLEERERNFRDSPFTDVQNDEKKLKAEIERLRKMGSQLLQEEISKVEREVEAERRAKKLIQSEKGTCRVTIRWQAEKNDPANGGYNHSVLYDLLSKYGEISALVVSAKKKGRALVEFKSRDAAMRAQKQIEGLNGNPLSLELLDSPPIKLQPVPEDAASSEHKDKNIPRANSSIPSTRPVVQGPSKMSNDDFELLVLQRLRRAQEDKGSS